MMNININFLHNNILLCSRGVVSSLQYNRLQLSSQILDRIRCNYRYDIRHYNSDASLVLNNFNELKKLQLNIQLNRFDKQTGISDLEMINKRYYNKVGIGLSTSLLMRNNYLKLTHSNSLNSVNMSTLDNNNYNNNRDNKLILDNMDNKDNKVIIDINEEDRNKELSNLFKFLDDFNIDASDRKKLEDILILVGQLLSVSKLGLTKRAANVLKSILMNEFKGIGLNNSKINDIFIYVNKLSEDIIKGRMINYKNIMLISDLLKGQNKDMLGKNELFILELINIASVKNVILDNSILQEIMDILNILDNYNYDDINKQIEHKMKDLILDFQNLISKKSYKVRRKGKYINKPYTLNIYSKTLNTFIKIFMNSCKVISVNYLKNKSEEIIKMLPKQFKNISKIINILHIKNVEILTMRFDKLNYNRESMKIVNTIRDLKINILKDNVHIDSIIILQEILELMNSKFNINKNNHVNNNVNIVNRMEKYEFNMNNPLTVILSKIIDDDRLDIVSKQVAMEKASLTYDLN